MSAPAKAERELLAVSLLAERYSPLHGAQLSCLKPPEPDLAAEVAGARFGIEVTEMIGDRFGRRIEGEQDGILARAQEIFEARGLPRIGVTVYWRRGFQFPKHERTLAEELANIVAHHLPPIGGSVGLGVDYGASVEFVHRAIDHIDIHREVEFEEGHWTAPRHWWGTTADCAFVQSQIARKTGRRAQYRGGYSECWLLLVHPGSAPSSGYDLPADLTERQFVSEYDRVLVVSMLGGQVTELRLTTSGSAPAT